MWSCTTILPTKHCLQHTALKRTPLGVAVVASIAINLKSIVPRIDHARLATVVRLKGRIHLSLGGGEEVRWLQPRAGV